MNKHQAKLRFAIIITVLTAVLISSCASPLARRNSINTGVYLESSDGSQYYNGATIYLGYVSNGGSDLTTTLNIVNESGYPITVNGTSVPEAVYETVYDNSQGKIDRIYPDVDNTLWSNITLTTTLTDGTEIERFDSSDDIDLTLTYVSSYTYGTISTRRYRFTIEFAANDSVDFEFEVIGYSEGNSGW